MRFLHTSDWHVGKKLRGRSRTGEHRAVLDEIVGIASERKVDFTIVAGDLFDVSSPSPADEELVYRSLLDLAEVGPVFVVSGNHDGPARFEAVRPLLNLGRIRSVATARAPEDGGMIRDHQLGLAIALLPFVSHRGVVRVQHIMSLDPDQHAQHYEERMRAVIGALCAGMGTDTVNVLVSHLTAYGGAVGGGEREAHVFGYAIPPQAFPGSLSYAALGHLHRQQRIPAPAPVWYSGSPLQFDFGERDDEKGVLVVEAEPGLPAAVEAVPLRSGTPLIQVTGTMEQVLARSDELGDAYVKVVLDEKARAGLSDEIREAIPGTVDVILMKREVRGASKPVSRTGRSPGELFAGYLESKEVADEAVLDLFREIEQEVLAR